MGDDSDDGDESSEGRRQAGDVRLDTFNEKFMSMNLDKIIHKIRDLYKDGFFYKKTGPNGIIAHVNAIRHYPIAQINLALTTMVSDPNEYVNDKYGRLGRVINVGDYYLFQPIEITDKRISIHERSTPVPFKHSSIQYPLPGEVTEDYLGVRLGEGPVLAPVPAAAFAVPNKKMADRVNKLVATVTAAQEGRVERSELEEMDEVYNGEAAVFEPEEAEPVNEIEDLVNTLTNTFETCLTVYEKPTKEQDEWYYYCGKVIDQISQTEEFQITKEELHELIIANLLEHLLFNDSLTLVNYLYEKNNYSMIVSDGGGGSSSSGGVAMVQPLMPFERMLLN